MVSERAREEEKWQLTSRFNGKLEAERAHSARETSNVECCDCFDYVLDADEDFCHGSGCGEPLCADCQILIADEPYCSRCAAALKKAAMESLQKDPQIGDLFRHLPKAA
jgi:hypothetical protein